MDAGRRKPFTEQGQLAVFGPEVMAPLADAVGLVDREPLHAYLREQVEQVGVDQSLRGCEEQPEFTGGQSVADLPPLVRRQSRVKCRGGIADRLQGIDLVFHERHQRRDDDVGRLVDQRRQLVAEAFSSAGRHHDERVVAGETSADGVSLERPQRLEAPPAGEDLADADVVDRLCGSVGRPWHRCTCGNAFVVRPTYQIRGRSPSSGAGVLVCSWPVLGKALLPESVWGDDESARSVPERFRVNR